MNYACPHTSSASNAADIPMAQKRTFLKPSWNTAKPVMPKANNQNIGYLCVNLSRIAWSML